MHEFSLNYLRCVRCCSKLDIDVFCNDKEIVEGILECNKCKLAFPVIEKIPIIWDDFSKYLSNRLTLGRKLYSKATHEKMKKFLKESLTETKKNRDDRTALEEKWSKIYQNNKNSKFYSIVKNHLKQVPQTNLVLEYGCSIGLMTSFLADNNNIVFGVDRSYDAISVAKKTYKKNLDYFVADSLSPLFGKIKFDLVLALNILELVEPLQLLKNISKQITKGIFVISDPYDFERGKNSVSMPLDETSLRKNLVTLGFSVSDKTKKPSHYPWNLKFNPRSTLNYKVDFIIAEK